MTREGAENKTARAFYPEPARLTEPAPDRRPPGMVSLLAAREPGALPARWAAARGAAVPGLGQAFRWPVAYFFLAGGQLAMQARTASPVPRVC